MKCQHIIQEVSTLEVGRQGFKSEKSKGRHLEKEVRHRGVTLGRAGITLIGRNVSLVARIFLPCIEKPSNKGVLDHVELSLL